MDFFHTAGANHFPRLLSITLLLATTLLLGLVAGHLVACGSAETEAASNESETPASAVEDRPPVLGAEAPDGDCNEDADCGPDDPCVPDGCAMRADDEPVLDCEETGLPIGACTCFEGQCQEVPHDAPGGRDEVRAAIN